MDEIRLQKFLADHGIASRRKCEEYILEGKVMVNGERITQLGKKINPTEDEIFFENRKIENISSPKVYILLNKPIGYVTTVKDQFERDTVLSLVKVKERVVPVGRLDMYTSGAILLSNDGNFIYQISHPKHEIDKTYVATVKGQISQEEKEKLEQGVVIEGGYQTKPARTKILHYDNEKDITRIEITIHEGKNRQVRKMCEAIRKKSNSITPKQNRFFNSKGFTVGKMEIFRNRRNKKNSQLKK